MTFTDTLKLVIFVIARSDLLRDDLQPFCVDRFMRRY